MMQKANAGYGKSKMDRERGESCPALVGQGRFIESESFVVWWIMSMERKIVIKKQRNEMKKATL